ncbi:phage tail assembly chaperone [Pseudomonas sp. LH1G9]|uniref:phage tail assembly chaperone n=1 Tax=Pseudomonas sp. LH1G9 TaxID=2083055 RepID=UPI0021149029|nr:phage tail assembly chaperone [Pseudomonas sp. LH1G9]
MKITYNAATGYVTALTDSSLPSLPSLDIPELTDYLEQLNTGLVPRVVDGELIWETDKAAAWDMIRTRRDELLVCADHALNIVYDEARIAQADPDQERIRAIAEYRQALRDITLAADPQAVVWPQKPWA